MVLVSSQEAVDGGDLRTSGVAQSELGSVQACLAGLVQRHPVTSRWLNANNNGQ